MAAYEWDEEKRKANIVAHKTDFAAAEGFDWDHAMVEIADREDYGELREQATGFIGVRLYVLVFSRRDDKKNRGKKQTGSHQDHQLAQGNEEGDSPICPGS